MSELVVKTDTSWTAVNVVGIGISGTLIRAYPEFAYVWIDVAGTTFTPWVELISGSSATVQWVDLESGTTIGGLTPTITWPDAGPHIVGLRVDAFSGGSALSELVTLNLGFDYTQDAGRYNLGSGYNWPSQPVTGIRGLQRLTGLVRFMAATPSLTGHLNFTGLSGLEYIECFQAQVTSIDLTGCSTLIRLCMEQTALTELDLNPVKDCLYDLRAANQNSASLTFTELTGDGLMHNLYHYCIRAQTTINSLTLSNLPVVEQWWVWNTNQTEVGTPISTVLNSALAYGNDFTQNAVDTLLIYLANNGPSTGNVRVNQGTSAAPSAAGLTAATELSNRGWNVEHN